MATIPTKRSRMTGARAVTSFIARSLLRTGARPQADGGFGRAPGLCPARLDGHARPRVPRRADRPPRWRRRAPLRGPAPLPPVLRLVAERPPPRATDDRPARVRSVG